MLKERLLQRSLYQQMRRAGVVKTMAMIMARRATDYEQCQRLLWLSLKSLTHPFLLAEMPRAVLRVVQALHQEEVIAIQTDYDCDGQTAHAVLYKALVEIFQHDSAKTLSFIGQRQTAGYGFNLQLAEQIIAQKATLVITADNGSSDIPSLKILAEHGIDVIVTDHHTVSAKPPYLYAFLNPAFENSQFADPAIAGCMVAWLFMAATYMYLKAKTPRRLGYSITRLLDYVAVGTLADCVSLLSHNNRIVVRYGMNLMNHTHKPIWQTLKQHLNKSSFTRETIQFYVAPLLNASSRVGDAYTGLAFLLANSAPAAVQHLEALNTYNLSRRALQKQALIEAQMQLEVSGPIAGLIFCVLEHSHAGINGVIASKLTSQTGQTTVILSVDAQHMATGSLRSTRAMSLVKVLQEVARQVPQLLSSFGGHHHAAGVSLKQENIPQFQIILTEIVQAQNAELHYTWHDGRLPDEPLEDLMQHIERLEPFGVDFPLPVFVNHGMILESHRFGTARQYLSLRVKIQSHILKGVFFQATEHAWTLTLKKDDYIQMVYALSRDQYNHEPIGIIQEIKLVPQHA